MNHVYRQVKRNLFLFTLLFVQLIISSFPGYAGMPESGRATINVKDTTPLLPLVFSFTPTSGTKGTPVVIFGLHFTGTTAVRFGGTLADTFTVISDTAIFATVGSGSSGNVSVTTPNGTASRAGFVFIAADTSQPVISFFTPTSGRRGTPVAIIGSHFKGTTAVRFGGTLADTFFVVSDSAIVARVGAGSSGSVAVTTPFGTGSKPGFTFISDTTIIDTAAPVIYNFSPTSARKGSVVTIFGSHFKKTTAVRFGGTLADTFAIQSDSLILAIVDTGSTGNVSVTTLYGTASKPGFTFIRDSTITDTTAPVIAITAKGNINEAAIANAPVSLYPNPASAYAIVTHPATDHPARVQIVEITGKVVRTINVGSNARQTKINTSGLVAGMYKVVWNNGAKSVAQTLLVK